MCLSGITDVFFDLDHTLWDFDKNSEIAFEAIFSKKHPNVNTADFINKYIPINQECWKLYQEDKISQEQLRYMRLRQTFDALSYRISDTAIHQLSEEYIELLPKSKTLIDGAISILDYLSPKYSLHIITNGFAMVQQQKMKNSGIEHYFATITNSETAGVKKPNPIIFEKALQMAQTKTTKSVMIGDSLEADVQGALRAGFEAIFFNPNQIEIKQEIKQVNHLLNLKNFL